MPPLTPRHQLSGITPGPKPDLVPAYDIDRAMLDAETHEMAFRIGEARMADDVVTDDLNALTRARGTRNFTRT